jgi:hypothetical protein
MAVLSSCDASLQHSGMMSQLSHHSLCRSSHDLLRSSYAFHARPVAAPYGQSVIEEKCKARRQS